MITDDVFFNVLWQLQIGESYLNVVGPRYIFNQFQKMVGFEMGAFRKPLNMKKLFVKVKRKTTMFFLVGT